MGDPLYNWNYLKNNHPDVKLFKADIRSFEEAKAASKDVDAIVHATAQVAITTSLSNPRMDFGINVLEAAWLNDTPLSL